MNEIWIWDKDAEQWNGNIFYSFVDAEDYVLSHGGYEKFDILERLISGGLMVDKDVLTLMKYFERPFINANGELILVEKGNVYLSLKNKVDGFDLACGLLEWCSRDVLKGSPYCAEWRNEMWRHDLGHRISCYLMDNFGLNKPFTDEQWLDIYQNIGNGINRRKTNLFVCNKFNFYMLR